MAWEICRICNEPQRLPYRCRDCGELFCYLHLMLHNHKDGQPFMPERASLRKDITIVVQPPNRRS